MRRRFFLRNAIILDVDGKVPGARMNGEHKDVAGANGFVDVLSRVLGERPCGGAVGWKAAEVIVCEPDSHTLRKERGLSDPVKDVTIRKDADALRRKVCFPSPKVRPESVAVPTDTAPATPPTRKSLLGLPGRVDEASPEVVVPRARECDNEASNVSWNRDERGGLLAKDFGDGVLTATGVPPLQNTHVGVHCIGLCWRIPCLKARALRAGTLGGFPTAQRTILKTMVSVVSMTITGAKPATYDA